MRIVIYSCSLNPGSNSRKMARHAQATLEADGHTVDFVDLQDHDLPFCAGGNTPMDADAREVMRDQVRQADAAIMAVPIYNYDVNAAAKNLIELTGRAWEYKTVGFLAAAGSKISHMSVMGIANSLMLDFRCVVVPRFVMAEKPAFDAEGIISDAIRDRVDRLCAETAALAEAWTAAQHKLAGK